MVINKLKITLLISLFSFFLCSTLTFANENIPIIKASNYDEIYSNLEEADFEYIFGLDPHQADDYTKYMFSPYPLFRSGVNLVFKTKKIPAGYYLLTPREKNGKTYVLFKENGKVAYTIPVYEEDIVPETFYQEKIPYVKQNLAQKTNKKFMGFIGTKWGHRNQRTPLPEAYIEFNDKGIYWDMHLYYGEKKYSLLFKKD